ncbi:MAG: phage Gp37/Gp68 family protein [Planctomycetes bacterium]|nr:phage Gp37/Gp68 family protein [Planctomycetota bacterium]
MNRGTGIEWTEATVSPMRGCSRVSEGCRNCYAERWAARWSARGAAFHGFVDAETGKWTGRVEIKPQVFETMLKTTEKRVFVNSMSDTFHESLSDHAIAAVYGVLISKPETIWQVVTKRPARAYEFLRAHDADDCLAATRAVLAKQGGELPERHVRSWPPANVHLLTSVEDRASAADRIPPLLGTRAPVIGLSCEPLLEEVDLSPWIHALKWVIVGGESGSGARPMHPAWARAIRDQCVAAGVPFFFKQWGQFCPAMMQTPDATWLPDQTHGPALMVPWWPRRDDVGRLLDGRIWSEYPKR